MTEDGEEKDPEEEADSDSKEKKENPGEVKTNT